MKASHLRYTQVKAYRKPLAMNRIGLIRWGSIIRLIKSFLRSKEAL
jgi:hypothetical protein